MKILFVHNYYKQKGGEDTVFESDVSLIRSKGHEVYTYIEDNEKIDSMPRIKVAFDTIWSHSSYHRMKETIQKISPDIVQFYNTFPLVSPSAYYACLDYQIPVIQYLFNPRLLCPAASLYRNQELCTDCVGKIPPWPGILHGCYHHSRLHTLIVGSMVTFHHVIGTWHSTVDFYLSATEFYRNLYIEGGLPSEKIIVKPNYIFYDPKTDIADAKGEYVLFIARLDPEKGVKTMMNAWKNLNIPLKIRGSGQLEGYVRDIIRLNKASKIEIISRLNAKELIILRKTARFFIWPSEGYYETFGLAAVECFAQGVPVIASNIGVMAEIVKDGETGLLFRPGDSADLAAKAQWLWDHPEEFCSHGA